MATKTRRYELRMDPEQDQLISRAAELMKVSKSKFMCDVAFREAEKVIGRSEVTLMDAELFDQMMAAVDAPDDAPELARLASQPRLIEHA